MSASTSNNLLICITTDTLLDQVNGARNNKGGSGSLEDGGIEVVFPCLQHSHGAGGRRSGLLQPHGWPREGGYTHCGSSLLALGRHPILVPLLPLPTWGLIKGTFCIRNNSSGAYE